MQPMPAGALSPRDDWDSHDFCSNIRKVGSALLSRAVLPLLIYLGAVVKGREAREKPGEARGSRLVLLFRLLWR